MNAKFVESKNDIVFMLLIYFNILIFY